MSPYRDRDTNVTQETSRNLEGNQVNGRSEGAKTSKALRGNGPPHLGGAEEGI